VTTPSPPASGDDERPGGASTPLDDLGVLAMETVSIDDNLDHLEIYTAGGLLTLLWHGAADASGVVVCLGGAMGGLLGPDGGMFHQLGRRLPAHDADLGVMRVSYRQPNDLSMCVHDALAAMELAARHGGQRFVPVGHSFGGAVAVQSAAHLEAATVPAVVTFATQSAGCEQAELLADRDLLFVHGTEDRILPYHASELVRMLAGTGELVLVPGADHLLRPAGTELLARMETHLPAVLGHDPVGTNTTS